MEVADQERRRITHPFGRENHVSVKQLFRFFCNNLHLGQWELARACIAELYAQAELIRVDIKDVLRDIAVEPNDCSLGSPSVSTPHQLSWLCLTEYEKLAKDKEKSVVDRLRQDTEFQILLIEVCQGASKDIIKELFTHYKCNQQQLLKPPILSEQCQQQLRLTLSNDPSLGHCLIQYLTVTGSSPHADSRNEQLQKMYIECMYMLLENIESISLNVEVNEEEKTDIHKKCRTLYELLSLFNPTKKMKNLPLTDFFTRLINLCQSHPETVQLNSIYSSFLGRDNDYILTLFCDIEYKLVEQKFSQSKPPENDFRGQCPDVQHMLAVAQHSDRRFAWRQAYLRGLKMEYHFLENLMDVAMDLIQNELYTELQSLLEPPEFQVLKPMVLLVGWNYCYTCGRARQLLQALWNEQDPCLHPVLAQACRKLSYQVDLVQWCLDRARPLMVAAGIPQQTTASDLFQGLETHSVLYMLHHSTRLAQLHQDEVMDILLKSPVDTERSVDKVTETKEEQKSGKTVRFEIEDDLSHDLKQPTSIEQMRDCAIYRSYCAIKCFMEAILFCADPITSATMTVNDRPSHDLELDLDLDVNGDSQSKPYVSNYQDLYNVKVLEKLRCGKQLLSKLYPLTFRVETLEDIFSLLFVSHQDIEETFSDSGEEGDMPRSLNVTVDSRRLSVASDGLTSLENSIDEPEILKKLENVEDENKSKLVSETSVSQDQSTLAEDAEEATEVNYSLEYDIPYEDEHPKHSDHTRKGSPRRSRSRSGSSKSGVYPVEIQTKSTGVFAITKTRLRDDDNDEAHSGNTSAFSSASSSNNFKLGFVANEYLVRDILAILKECMVDVSAAKYALLGQPGVSSESSETEEVITKECEAELTKHVKSTISPSAFQLRMTRLNQYISEATWRYQLVVDDKVSKTVGEISTDKVTLDDSYSSDDLGSYEDDESSGSNKEKVSLRRKVTSKGRRSWDSVTSGKESGKSGIESESQETLGSGASTEGAAGKKRRKRSRSRTRSSRRISDPVSMKRDKSLVARMLASHDALLFMCLKRGNYAQAQQVIKMFSMEGKSGAMEVLFAEQYGGAVRQLQTFQSGDPGTSKPRAAGKFNLGAIKKAAEAGVAKLTVSGIVDKVLMSSNLPMFSEDLLEEIQVVGASSLSSHISPKNIPSMIMLDLACCGCRSLEPGQYLLNLAKQRLGEGKPQHTEKGSKSEAALKGLPAFLDQLSTLGSLGGSDDSSVLIKPDVQEAYFKNSINKCLLTATQPLEATTLRAFVNALLELQKGVDNVEKALLEVSREERQIHLASMSPARRKAGPLKPITHNAMKQLMAVQNKHVSTEGLQSFLHRSSSKSTHRHANYLESLYEHVKSLAYLVVECEGRAKTDPPTNYFRMLQDGPTVILGRLMFGRKMPPSRLEDVVRKLNLNLTSIIVKNCCPAIPSKRLTPPAQYKEPVLENGKLILNFSADQPTSVRHPEIVARELLTRIIQLMKAKATEYAATPVFTMTAAIATVKTAEYKDIVRSTTELAWVDLDAMETKEQKICFYGNLINLMYIHVALCEVERQLQELDIIQSRPRSQSQITTTPPSQVNFPSGILDQVLLQTKMAYNVGQLGTVCLFDLHHTLCHSGLYPPAKMNGLVADRSCGKELDPLDPWYKYALHPEPRLLFVISEGFQSSPPLTVLNPELVHHQLDSAMTAYLMHTVQANQEQKIVVLPKLLIWYQLDFAGDKVDKYGANYEGLITFIVTHVTDDLESSMKNMMDWDAVHEFGESIDSTGTKELPFKVVVKPFNYEFGFSFEFSKTGEPSNVHGFQQSHRRTSSLPPDLESSDSSIKSRCSVSSLARQESLEKAAFRITPVTLEYLKSSSHLVATLVSLVCADDIEESELARDDVFSQSIESSDSDMSIVDIKSYRYQRLTNDFPALHRHILQHTIPVAGAADSDILLSPDPVLKFSSSNIDPAIRACVLAIEDSGQFQLMVYNTLYELLMKKNWDGMLDMMAEMPRAAFDKSIDLRNFRDFILVCSSQAVLKKLEKSTDKQRKQLIQQSLHQLQAVQDTDLKSRAVIGALEAWPIDTCIDMLESCMQQQHTYRQLQQALKQKSEEMKIYQRITECAKHKQIKSSLLSKPSDLDLEHSELDRFADWRYVVKQSRVNPAVVLKIMLTSHEFDTARNWRELHQLGENTELAIEEAHIFYLLNQNQVDLLKAFQTVEQLKIKHPSMCLQICRNLLKSEVSHQTKLFLAQFILSQLGEELDKVEKDDLHLICVGAKALLCLPEHTRHTYEHLLEQPSLIMEQLLMNMKTDWALQVYRCIKPYYECCEYSIERECSVEKLDGLVKIYATKALEVQVSTLDKSPQRSATTTPSPAPPDHSAQGAGDMKGKMTRNVSTASLASMSRSPHTQQDYLTSSSYGAKTGKELIDSYYDTSGQFVMPTEPPDKEHWVVDMAVDECMVCRIERFGMFNRRHHCRRCGRVVCATCSTHRSMVRGESARICEECYQLMFRPRVDGSKSRLSGSKFSPSSQEPSSLNTIKEEPEHRLMRQETEYHWTLTTDGNSNKSVREEFYYEHAPSIPLCMSILQLHSSPKESSHLMLSLCDNLSKMLNVGQHNSEVDHNLVISMMKYLLFHAKVKFLSINDNHGVALCDNYLSHVDLVSVLVGSNCTYIPSIEKLSTQRDSTRRLRDKLIEDERLSRAIVVSNKCGLDPLGVWAAWGLSCLKAGDFAQAREKFQKCLKVPVDKNQLQQTSPLLNEIIECIEGFPSTGVNSIQALKATLKSMKDLIAEPPVIHGDESYINDQHLEECLYYLKTYGTYGNIISFYRKHGYWMKSVQYVLDKKCSTDIFIECLLVPALHSGELSKLTDQIIMTGQKSEQEKWFPYLKAACMYANKMKFYHVLYELQIFMKDFIRAAMTCITYFYQGHSISYNDLVNRMEYLSRAKQHFEEYLEQKLWLSGQRGKKGGQRSGETVCLVLPPSEVNRYINTVSLQTEVTKFLHHYYTVVGPTSAAPISSYKPGKIPTLFGNNNVKGDVVHMVMLAGKNINDGFGLAFRIIQEFHLDATRVYTVVGRQLAKQHRYLSIRQLLTCIKDSGLCDDQSYDEVIGACVRVIADEVSEAKEAESLIKMLRSNTNKINAYILCGKLRSAYLIAVKEEREDDVVRIGRAAEKAGQSAVKSICEKWIQQKRKKFK